MIVSKIPSKEMEEKYSSEMHVSKDSPKVHMWQCARNNTVDIYNSKKLDEELTKKKNTHIYHTYDSDAHGWGIAKGKPAEGWVEEMYNFYLSK